MKEKCIIYITEKCTLSCPHCYVNKSGAEMSPAVSSRIIRYLQERKDKYENFVFMGGETMLAVDTVIKFVHGVDCEETKSYVIMTNGTVPIENLDKRLTRRERKKFCYVMSIKDMNTPPAPAFKKNLEYLKENHLDFILVTVATPKSIEWLELFVKYAKSIGPSNITILRQHMLGDYWNDNDVERYAPVLKRLLHMKLYYENTVKRLFINMPGKPYLSIAEGADSYKKYGINIVDQDSFCQYKIIGIDGKAYHCDGACGQKTHDYGYVWEDRPNKWIRELGYQDTLYDYCELAHNKVCLPFDELNDRCRIEYKELERLILELKRDCDK